VVQAVAAVDFTELQLLVEQQVHLDKEMQVAQLQLLLLVKFM
jgi:hypothetical protein